MELLCWDPECVGNDLTAGCVPAALGDPFPACAFCDAPLLTEDGRMILEGALPLVGGRPVRDFDELMDSPGVRVARVTAVEVGDLLLTCVLTEGGVVLAAAIHQGENAAETERLMALMTERP